MRQRGARHRHVRPRAASAKVAARLDPGIRQLHSSEYKNPTQLQPGTTAETEAWLDTLDPATTPAEDITDLRAIAAAVNHATAAERRVREAVETARSHGRSWARIGIALGVSRQAARERYGTKLAA